MFIKSVTRARMYKYMTKPITSYRLLTFNINDNIRSTFKLTCL